MQGARKIKGTLKALDHFKNKQKSVWSNVFRYVEVCIFWKCIQCTTYWDKTQMLKKFPSDKKKKETVQKTPSFFFRELQLATVLLFICDSYTSWITRFVSLKLCEGFSIFDPISFLLKLILLFNKKHGLFAFKTP